MHFIIYNKKCVSLRRISSILVSDYCLVFCSTIHKQATHGQNDTVGLVPGSRGLPILNTIINFYRLVFRVLERHSTASATTNEPTTTTSGNQQTVELNEIICSCCKLLQMKIPQLLSLLTQSLQLLLMLLLCLVQPFTCHQTFT